MSKRDSDEICNLIKIKKVILWSELKEKPTKKKLERNLADLMKYLADFMKT